MSSAKKPKKKEDNWAKFNNDWLNLDNCKSWLVRKDIYNGFCNFCNSNIAIKYEGFSAIKKHIKTPKHSKHFKPSAAKVVNQTPKINSVFERLLTKEEEKVVCAELTFIYHSLKRIRAITQWKVA
jgi:hypothetical protein